MDISIKIDQEQSESIVEQRESIVEQSSRASQHQNNVPSQLPKIIVLAFASAILLALIFASRFYSPTPIAKINTQNISKPGSNGVITSNEQKANISISYYYEDGSKDKSPPLNYSIDDILPNPFNDENHTFISKQQIDSAKALRDMLSHSPNIVEQLSNREKYYYNEKYKINQYSEFPFCIIVPTFNNKLKKRHLRNIKSVLMQDYSKFHLIVIDDASTDSTGKEIQDYLNKENQKIIDYKVTFNQERKYSLANIRSAAKQFCLPQEIMMVVDGDDELIGKQVLKVFNAIFQEKEVWLAYSNSLSSDIKLGYSRPYHPSIIEANSYRRYAFTVSHLRAYYTWLFLMVQDADLQDGNGRFLSSAGDMAACVPMLEMAHNRVAYVPEITYLYNIHTGLNVHKDRLNEQRQNNLRIRARQKYQALTDSQFKTIQK